MKIVRPTIPNIEPLAKDASLDEQHDKIQEIIRVTKVPLQSGERIDPWSPPWTLHKPCVTHGCVVCEVFCTDHGCRKCMAEPCGNGQCLRCYEGFGTTDPVKWNNRKGKDSAGEVAMITHRYLSPDAEWGIHGVSRHMKADRV